MIEPNILAFQNADILTAIDEKHDGFWAVSALAEHVGRDDSNLGKTLRRLSDEGLLLKPPTQGLTDEGRAQLAAWKRARHGGERRKAQGRWSADNLRRNPLNRPIDPEHVLALADITVGAGDILIPLILSPPDAHGVRMIWAGEHRWEAVKHLTRLGQLPEALGQGLPFVERVATPGEAALIAVIENTGGLRLRPWEDARLLWAAAQELGLERNASELARRVGRAVDGARNGLRDVQVKLKVAREATKAAIAAYEAAPDAPGAWERLRDSVSAPREEQAQEQSQAQGGLSAMLADYGPAVAAGQDAPDPDLGGDDQAPRAAEPAIASIERYALPNPKPGWRGGPLVEIEIGHIDGQGWIVATHGQLAGGGWGDPFHDCPANPERYATRDEALAAAINAVMTETLGASDREARMIETWLVDLGTTIDGGPIDGGLGAVEPAEPPQASEPEPSDPWLDGGWAVYPIPGVKGAVGGSQIGPASARPAGVAAAPLLTVYSRTEMRGRQSVTLYRARATVTLPDGSEIESLRIPGCATTAGAIQLATEDLLYAMEDDQVVFEPAIIRPAIEWLDAMTGPHVVGGRNCLNASRAQERRFALGWDKRQANSGGGAAPAESSEAEAQPAAAPTQAAAAPRVTPLDLLRIERMRQIEVLDYGAAHDDAENGDGELAMAAAAYAVASHGDPDAALFWPGGWDPEMFKPAGGMRDLVKAGALILAEIERRQRLADEAQALTGEIDGGER